MLDVAPDLTTLRIDPLQTAAEHLPADAREPAPSLERIVEFQNLLLSHPEVQVDLPPIHHFAPGMYARELRIPAGITVVGKTHARDHLCLIDGDITVVMDGARERVTGRRLVLTKAGTKRAVYAHADSVFITFHVNPSDTRDLERIEAEHIIPEMLPAPARAALEVSP